MMLTCGSESPLMVRGIKRRRWGVLGKVKWKANTEVKQQRTFLRRFRLPIATAGIIVTVIGVFVYLYSNSRYQYGDATTDYQRAMADCFRDHTRLSDSDYAADAATAACVKETPGGR